MRCASGRLGSELAQGCLDSKLDGDFATAQFLCPND
jgi:hypothetical protein